MWHVNQSLLMQGALLGVLHALIPCVHSWPMLLPFLARGQSPVRIAVLFGAGMTCACVAVGALLGSLGSALPEEWMHRAEELTGVVLVLIGLMLLWRTRVSHLGHIHSECEPEGDHHCEHATHRSARFADFGPAAALFFLGIFNALVPCWTNVAALALAAPLDSPTETISVLLAFALCATAVMALLLCAARRGLGLLERLRRPGTESLVLLGSGLLLIMSGLSLLFHWHTHD
jgi:nickel/cobalt exporter